MPVSISGTDGITSPTITTTSTIVSGTTVADATAVIRPLVSATAVDSTSGTSIDFTGIPSWVKRITVMFNGVSLNGSSQIQIQIGSGSVTTSGYASGAWLNNAYSTSTTGLLVTAGYIASYTFTGVSNIHNISGNTWVSASNGANIANGATAQSGGSSPALGGALDRIRITTINGTDAFDAGTINILYE